MTFVKAAKTLPNFGERVIVKTVDGYYFSATFETDEEGDYWAYDLPAGIVTDSAEVTQEISSWSYIQ